MAFYFCNAIEGVLSKNSRKAIAKGITTAHCKTTGTPKEYIHVYFFEDLFEESLEGKKILVTGNIIGGETSRQKERLAELIIQAVGENTPFTQTDILVTTNNVPEDWIT